MGISFESRSGTRAVRLWPIVNGFTAFYLSPQRLLVNRSPATRAVGCRRISSNSLSKTSYTKEYDLIKRGARELKPDIGGRLTAVWPLKKSAT